MADIVLKIKTNKTLTVIIVAVLGVLAAAGLLTEEQVKQIMSFILG